MKALFTLFLFACSPSEADKTDPGGVHDSGGGVGGSDDGGEDDSGSPPDNAVPTSPEVAVGPEAPLAGDALDCTVVTESTDADGDALTYRWSWTVDGVDAGIEEDTVPADRVGAWQDWQCQVVASDGQDDSDPGTASVTTRDECVALDFEGEQMIFPSQTDGSAFAVGTDGEPITMEGWFQAGSGPSQFLFFKGDAAGLASSLTFDYMLAITEEGDLHFATGPSSGHGDYDPCAYNVIEAAVSFDTWHHIAASYDPATGTSRVHVDGAELLACSGEDKNPGTTGWLVVGGHAYAEGSELVLSRHFRGVMDEVRVSRVVRYEGDFEPVPWHEPDEDTQLLLHLNDSVGMVAEDASGQGHDGLLQLDDWSASESACTPFE